MCNLLLAACGSGDDIPGSTTLNPNPGSTPISGENQTMAFEATMGTAFKGSTRTPANEMTNTSLQTDGFGVFACYTGLHGYSDSNVRPDFMYNQLVTYASTACGIPPTAIYILKSRISFLFNELPAGFPFLYNSLNTE